MFTKDFIKKAKCDIHLYGAIAGGLLSMAAGLAGFMVEGFGGGLKLMILLGCMPAALFLIWLGFSHKKVLQIIKAFSERVAKGKNLAIRKTDCCILKNLSESVKTRIEENENKISELEKQNKELNLKLQLSKRQKINNDAIIHSIQDAVIVIDDSFRILVANNSAGQLFGFDNKSCQNKKLDDLIKHNEFKDVLQKSIKSKVRHTNEELTFEKEDAVKNYSYKISSIYDENQKACGLVVVLHDITREKEISKLKDDFVSHVSHELKTPLASITAYSEMLVDGEANDEDTREEFYSIIQSQAQRLNRLIEDILNTSRIESGLIKVNKEPISLTILIEDQIKMIKSYAEEKNIEVIGQTPIVYDQVLVDKDMITQVLVNLLSNAVKYTRSGGKVTVESEVDDEDNMVRVKVTDTGVGIPPEDVPHVFDKFFRVGSNKKVAKGTGLGLNLVKQIVEKVHKGKVFVESEVGKGSTFGFELPLATAEMAEVV